jgi:predicted CXXCH cytochrome family protein
MRFLLLATVVALMTLAIPAWSEIDQKEVCLACHDDLEAPLAARFKHPPAADGECAACHNPHVSRFAGLLLDRPGPLCGECHDEIRQSLDRSVVHAPVAEGRCVDCHTPHGGEHRNLLTKAGIDLCVECHAEVADWRARPVQHAPFGDGDCATCHDLHASDNPGLAELPGSEICTTCHDVNLAFRTSHSGYPVQTAACQGCHDPHASEAAALFRDNLHPPFADGACSDCHALPGSSEPFRTNKPQRDLCGDCHEDQVTESLNAAFVHVSAGGGECSRCHNPHTADGPGLLNEPQQVLCLECHDPGGAKSGEEGRNLTHGDGVDCSVCHAPHGAAVPALFAGPVIEVCGACHSHQHSIAHPMGEDSKDPRTGQEMNCLSCHGLHDAPFPKYLHREGDRELCVGCHRRQGGGQK